MKIEKKCIPCIVNQALKFIDTAAPEDSGEMLKKVFGYMSRADLDEIVTPELVGELFSLVAKEAGSCDPYRSVREFYNKMLLEQSGELERQINSADDPFKEAVKYAIIGNIIDFSPDYDLSAEAVHGYFSKFKNESLAIDCIDQMRSDIKAAKTIVYLGDNCGEICLDKLLLKKIKATNPDCRIYFTVKGAPALNDSVKEDALNVGIEEYATVIDNGDSSLGTVLYRTSEDFRRVFECADMIISKGQANYECLSDSDKRIYFLLMAKCKVIADDISVGEMSMVCMKSQK